MKMVWIFLGSLTFLYMFALAYNADNARIQMHAAIAFERHKLLAEFQKEVGRAKVKTSDPCSDELSTWVRPSAKLGLAPVHVVAGRDMTGTNLIYVPTIRDGDAVLVVMVSHAEPIHEELMWYAYGSKACKAGLSKEIKAYAITYGRHSFDVARPPWPSVHK